MTIQIEDRPYWINQIQIKRMIQIKYYEDSLYKLLKENKSWWTKNEWEIAFAKGDLEDAKYYYVILESSLKSDKTSIITLSAKEYNDLA